MKRLLGLMAIVVSAILGGNAALAAAAVSSGNLLQNPGAEEGTCSDSTSSDVPIPGWAKSGDPTVLTYASEQTLQAEAGPKFGGANCYFMGGTTSPTSLTQTVSVSAFATDIDAGGLPMRLAAALGGFSSQDDNMVITAQPLDGGGSAIGSALVVGPATAFDRSQNSTLVRESKASAVPAGTRSIRVTMVATRLQGSDNDGSADLLSLQLGSPTPPVVKITKTPPKETAAQVGTFEFTGEPFGTYECSIDNGPFKSCASGDTFKNLAPGDHRFRVHQTLDEVTGPDASYEWTIALPKACVLRTARARVFVPARGNRFRLVIRYTSYKPAAVSVSYKGAGTKGKVVLGKATRKFQKKGVFKLPVTLSGREAGKVRASKRFTVKFKITGTPVSCTRFYSKRLTIPKKVSGQTIWFQSDSKFAPGG